MHQLDPLGPLISAIERCIDEEGNVRESATAALLALTHHANALKQRMRTKLEHILGSLRFAALLQEPYFAQRENRYGGRSDRGRLSAVRSRSGGKRT